jgi:hypothetical protein
MYLFFCRLTPKQAGVRASREIFMKDFTQPWASWGVIGEDVRDRWFKEWKKKVTWAQCDERKMREAFERVGSKKLSDIFRKARKSGKRPDWIDPIVWDALLAHWATCDF